MNYIRKYERKENKKQKWIRYPQKAINLRMYVLPSNK